MFCSTLVYATQGAPSECQQHWPEYVGRDLQSLEGGGTIASARPRELYLNFLCDKGLLCSASYNSKVYEI